MRRSSFLLAGLAALALALAPAVAEARAGGGASMGSRGSRTFMAPPTTGTAPSTAAPVERSFTSPTSPSPGFGATSPGLAPQRPGLFGGGLFSGGGFMSGLAGGLIGAGIGGMLFGHGMFGGISGIGGFLGLLLQIFLVVLLVRFLVGMFRRRMPAMAGGPSMFTASGPAPLAMGGGAPASSAVAIGPADYQGFEATLKSIQAAWTAQDLAGLSRLATPEMMTYFNEQLADLSSRGQRNSVTDVVLDKGDLAEAWAEGGRDYATVAMRFSMIDATRDATGRVVDGSATERVSAVELWTFVRAAGGRWILSAIQQAR